MTRAPIDTKKPFSVLIRRANRWHLWAQFMTIDDAERESTLRIRGRGVSAWTWWGPTAEAAKLLAE